MNNTKDWEEYLKDVSNPKKNSEIDTKVYSLAVAVLDLEDYKKFKKWLIYKEYIESPFDGKYISSDHRVKISSSGNIFVTSDLVNTFYACNGINKIML